MPERRASPRDSRTHAAALADELRAVVEALALHDPDADDLAAATELARALRRRLSGPRRPRWYPTGPPAAAPHPESGGGSFDRNPIRGRLNPLAPPLRVEPLERADGRRAVRGRARLGIAYQGPPSGVHGGWLAALFDDLLGAAQDRSGTPAVTASLAVRYRQPTPIGEELRLEGWIERDRGRRVVAKASCHAGEILTAQAEALLVRVDLEEFRERMERRRADR